MKYTGFLCGGFSVMEGKHNLERLWTEENYTDEKIHECENYYLPEFVRFNLNSKAVEFGTMTRFSMPLGKTLKMGVSVDVPELKLYLLPFNMAIFAIRVEIDSEDINGITSAVSSMRVLNKAVSIDGFEEAVLEPLKKTYNILTGKDESYFRYSDMVENGNKLKIFQIACVDGDKVCDRDILLFELGTVAPIGSYDEKSLYSASECYFDRILSENKLSVFNNWSCLGLVDTVTILGENCPEWLVGNWINDYFGMIYIWQLFRKNYIFRLTGKFRFEKKDPGKLVREAYEFERKCSFSIISYNFLPEEFNRCIEHGLKIEEDKDVLYSLLEQENEIREKDSDTKMNYFLFFMTCLTMFSAVYDACCLFNELFPDGNHLASFRFLASVMSFVIFLALFLNRLFSNKNR